MNERLKYAAELLKKENYTLVLYNGTELVTSKDKGIKPLLDLYKKADEIIENAKKNSTWKKGLDSNNDLFIELDKATQEKLKLLQSMIDE